MSATAAPCCCCGTWLVGLVVGQRQNQVLRCGSVRLWWPWAVEWVGGREGEKVGMRWRTIRATHCPAWAVAWPWVCVVAARGNTHKRTNPGPERHQKARSAAARSEPMHSQATHVCPHPPHPPTLLWTHSYPASRDPWHTTTTTTSGHCWPWTWRKRRRRRRRRRRHCPLLHHIKVKEAVQTRQQRQHKTPPTPSSKATTKPNSSSSTTATTPRPCPSQYVPPPTPAAAEIHLGFLI